MKNNVIGDSASEQSCQGGKPSSSVCNLPQGRSKLSDRGSIQVLRPAAHSGRQKPPSNLMGGGGPVRSAITCAVQPVAKLSNLGAARSEDVGLEGGAGVGDG